MTFVAIADARDVSETTFAETWAFVSAPKEKAPLAMRKVAPYRACESVVARNMIYPIIISGAPAMKKIILLSIFQLRKGNKTVKKAPTT